MARLQASIEKVLEQDPELVRGHRRLTASLEKHGINPDELNLEVSLTLDRSGSTEGDHWRRYFYRRGIMQKVVRRVIPVALRVDGNGALDGTMFSNDAVDLGEVKITDRGWEDIVNTWVRKFRAETTMGDLGGTNLLEALLLNLDRYARKYSVDSTDPAVVAMGGGWMEVPEGWMDTWRTESGGGRRGWLGRSRGSGRLLPRLVKPALIPLINFTFCDGDVSLEVQRLVIEFLKATCFLPYFESLIGLGDDEFKFFSDLDDELRTEIDHVNFSKIVDITRISDEELYDGIVLGEFAIPTPDKPRQTPWLAVVGSPKYNIIVPTALPVR
jgi:hypothetical protein